MKKIGTLILGLIALYIFIILLSNLGVTYIISISYEGINSSFNYLKYCLKQESIITTLLIASALFGYFAFLIIKRKMLGFKKIVENTDKADSNAYDNAALMTSDEITHAFGNFEDATFMEKVVTIEPDGQKLEREVKRAKYDYKWSELSKYNFEGLAIRTFKKNGELYLDSIPKLNSTIIGAPGSGKTLYFISPTIEANAKSKRKATMIINDLKGELYARHSKMLKEQGYNVVVLNLRTPRKSLRFNPLSAVYDLYHKFIDTNDFTYLDKCEQQIADISNILIPPTTGDNANFIDGARGLLVGILWAMLEDSAKPGYNFTRDMFTIEQISNLVNKQINPEPEEPGQTAPNILIEYLKERRDVETSKVIESASAVITSKSSEKTFASYMSSFASCMQDYFKGAIKYVTSKDEIKLEEIVSKPTALFLIIPDESKAFYSVATLIIQQIYNYLIDYASTHPIIKEDGTEEPTLERPVYFLLDEFGNMPKISAMQTWITISRSRKIYFTLILQSKSQLQAVYGEQEMKIILDSCQMQMYLGSNEIETIKFFQEKMGTYTAFSHNANINEQLLSAVDYAGSTSLMKRDVVNISDLQYMKPGTAYFIVNREKPVKTNLVPHFDEECRKKKYFEDGKIDLKDNITSDTVKFYNLNERHNIFISGKENMSPSKAAPIKKDEEENIKPKAKKEIDEEWIEIDRNPIEALSEKAEQQSIKNKKDIINQMMLDALSQKQNISNNEGSFDNVEEIKAAPITESDLLEFDSLEEELLFDTLPTAEKFAKASKLKVKKYPTKEKKQNEDVFASILLESEIEDY